MTASVKPAGPNYTVKDVETIAAGKDVRARLFTLAPGEVIPWHSHSEIADHFFILGGELTVETRSLVVVVPLALASAIGLMLDTRIRPQIAAELIVGF
jgi:quercetin dioxygenase-like cupin family protein